MALINHPLSTDHRISGRDYLKLLFPQEVLKNYPFNRNLATVKQKRIMASIDYLVEEIKIAKSLDKIDRLMSTGSFVTDLWFEQSLFSWSYENFFLNRPDDEEIHIRDDVKKAFKTAYDSEQQKTTIKPPPLISDHQGKIHSEVPPLSQDGVPDGFEIKNIPLLLPQDFNVSTGRGQESRAKSFRTIKDDDYFKNHTEEYQPIAFDLLKSKMTYDDVASHPRISAKRNELLERDFPEPIDAEDLQTYKRLLNFPSARTIKRWNLEK